MDWKKFRAGWWPEIFFLIFISGLVYLPRIGELTYYRDDWYFLYDALVIGPKVFVEIALHTRPIRGPLYELYYSLFGLNPFPYHLVMYLTRLAGGLGALWLFNLLWPGKRHANFFMATLFVIFPGFLWWVAGFEFQPYVLSVSLQVFSIAFTLKAIGADSSLKKAGWMIGAILSGWIYLALVEYAIGMEAFRLLCVYVYVRNRNAHLDFRALLRRSVRASLPYLIIPVAFVFWYQFLFDNWRKAQDATTQLGRLFDSPLTAIRWLVALFRSVLNVSVLAWIVPFSQNFYNNRLRDISIGLIFSIGVVLLVLAADMYLKKYQAAADEEQQSDKSARWQAELLWAGLLGTIAGVLPVVLANRVVVFDRISQYTLPASLAGVIFLGGLIYSLFPKTIRLFMLSLLIGLAALSQHGLAAQAVYEGETIRDFWWQVVWRAPSIRSGTTLVATYPGLVYAEGNEMVWGPANFIYYPGRQSGSPVNIPISAARMEPDSLVDIMMGSRDFQRTDLIIKNISITYDYRNLLILSQPAAGSCVHAIDKRWPDLSVQDAPFMFASVQNSTIENIVDGATSQVPPRHPFGEEPAHEWCFYYQKADLARQTGDWEAIAGFEQEVRELGLHPNDQIEWMPFLQAYAFLGDEKKVKEISTRINTEFFYKQQACKHLKGMAEHGYALTPEMQSYVDELFCSGRQ